MSEKTKSFFGFLFFLLAVYIIFIFIHIINPKIDAPIQKQPMIEIKENVIYAKQVDTWLVPDSLDPQREEIITIAALLDAYNIDETDLGVLAGYLENNNIIYEHSMQNSLTNYFKDYQINYQPISKNLTTDELFELVNAGIPVVSWITSDLKVPEWTNEKNDVYSNYLNETTVIVKEITNKEVIISDPHKGIISVDKDQFIVLYEACGCHALWLKE